MRETLEKPDPRRVLRTLKAFQRDTVDYVFEKMYDPASPARRFLVADEVGLGKTLVARGIIARAIDLLWDKVGRIDIVYICSNSAIARQNISRLNVTGHLDHQLPDRITLLPRDVRNLRHRKLNFISFTPGTSFNLRSSMGVAEERALIYWLLPESWRSGQQQDGAISLLCGAAERGRFKTRVGEFLNFYTLDEELQASFRTALTGQSEIAQGFRDLSFELGRRSVFTDDENRRRASVIGELRQLLARVCINALEPDLIILDEFQRFKDLLHGEDFASELARALFDYESSDGSEHSRVLLLSATPYKMYTLHDEADAGEQHLRDFVDTVRFLYRDDARVEEFTQVLNAYGRELWRARTGARSQVSALRDRMEHLLRQVMVRTERLAVTPDRNGMLKEVPASAVSLESGDLPAYVAMQRVAAVVNHGDTLEYWKSAPYALNFMEDYQLKERFREQVNSRSATLRDALHGIGTFLLTRSDVESYARIDPANARLRWLLDETIGKRAAERFWLPPSQPYYALEGPFAGADRATKQLVFSAWQVVPKVVASLVSYEAERRLLEVPDSGEAGANTLPARRRRRGRLRFTRSQGRLTGMPVLALMYPSRVLAELGDPLSVGAALRDPGGALPALNDVIDWTEGRIARALQQILPAQAATGAVDQRWYWAAPILLDLAEHEEVTRRWFGQANLSKLWGVAAVEDTASAEAEVPPDDVDRWADHVDEARALLEEGDALKLGPPPGDLGNVLAWLALGGPGTTALRAVLRVTGDSANDSVAVQNAAGQIAHGLRSLFNQPEVTGSLQRADEDETYWRRVLEYAGRGCLSAVLDEYAHVALEADSLAGKPIDQAAAGLAARMASALTLQTATLRADHVTEDSETRLLRIDDHLGFRTAFAVRYGARGEEGVAADRNEKLQTAFNSPFWPIVLCTTSVGQEGLDFHPYCHSVVHWNLPSNPVDLEQREGRVHRYKGHAVRKNVAAKHRDAAFGRAGNSDPWACMFQSAREDASADDDLVPYWIYTVDGGAQIERHVPMLPLSRDSARKSALQRALAVYRMAFGQSRQEDLVAFLAANVSDAERQQLAADAMIRLSPPPSSRRRDSGIDATVDREVAAAAGTTSPDTTTVARVSLDSFRSMLDEFAPLRRETGHRAHVSPVANAEWIQSLLDEFRQLAGPARDSNLNHRSPGRGIDQLVALLDAFAAIGPALVERADSLPRYRALLDSYVTIQMKQGV
jgi:hypothetical protein